MLKPPMGATLETYERCLHFALFAVKVNPDTVGKVVLIEQALAVLQALRAELKALDLAVLEKRAGVAYWDTGRLDPTIRALAAAARFGDSLDRGLRLVELLFRRKRPSDITKPTGTGLGAELADARLLRDAFALIPEAAAASSVKDILPRLEADIAGATTAHDELMKAIGTRKLAKRKVEGVKRTVREAFDRLLGQLTDQYPDQKDLVRSFFLPSDEERSAEEAEGEGEAPTGEGPGTGEN